MTEEKKAIAVAKAKKTREIKEFEEYVGYEKRDVELIRTMVAKNTDNTELQYFLKIAKGVDLNPLTKEIWCYKDNKGNLLIFAGRDGFLAIAQRDKDFAGLRSSEVCKGDEFKMNIATGEIEHNIGTDDRGVIIGAYAIVFRQSGENTIEWADMKTYNKGYNAWKSHPAEMIKKVAEVHALKKAFGMHGLYAEEEFNIQNETVMYDNKAIEAPKESVKDAVAEANKLKEEINNES